MTTPLQLDRTLFARPFVKEVEPFHLRILTPFALALAMAGCAQTAKVTPLAQVEENLKVGRGGKIVSLPKTMVTVDVAFEAKTVKPGKYNDLARPFLGIDPPEPSISLDGFTIGTVGKNDQSQAYWMEFPGGPFVNNDITIVSDPHGTMTSGTTGQDNKTVDFIVTSLGSLATIASTAAKAISATGDDFSETAKLVRAFLDFKGQKDKTFADKALQAEVVRLLSLDDATRKTELENSTAETRRYWAAWLKVAPEFDQIVAAVKKIKELNDEIKVALAEPDLKRLDRDATITSIRKELAPLLEPFIGTEEAVSGTLKWTVEPSNQLRNADLTPEEFRLFTLIEKGPDAGFRNILPGHEPEIPGSLKSPPKAQGGKTVRLVLVGQKPHGGGIYAKLESKSGPRSFRYRIPAETAARVMYSDETKARANLLVAQYGYMAYLPLGTGSASTKWDFTLDPATGALTKLSLNNKAYDPALVKQAGDAANNFLIAATTDRELLKAERNAKLLKARKDTMDLQKAIDQAKAEAP